ncbi:sigma-54 dependent transcriptional regulator [uncultured Thiodictyon sp.]|uniref:sigma-54-dependent transcriptional regulator n=1 Tax=uncultured Thiodictyon sp. TaxID=1846217 RepID=UPI0025F5D428|nr:sigma-54 dependent transcriptional regulator [uncultured Thiodictyon sp.]
MQNHLLIVADDLALNQLMVTQLQGLGYPATGVTSWRAADDFLAAHESPLIIADVRLRDGDTLERLPDLVSHQPVVVLAAFGSVRSAVAAMKAGAYDYLLTPASPEELALTVRRALDDAALRSDHRFYRQRLKSTEGAGGCMIGRSAALRRIEESIGAVAGTDINVLIQGEGGSGKELVARAIHERGDPARRHFVAVDCCTQSARDFESVLFGHERGAFAGADRQRRGLIESAQGGTLFLDEVGELEPSTQAKLLRVLETGVFRRVGGTKDLRTHARIVAATHRDLYAMSGQGQFRSDLFYRLSSFVIAVPPLRERREDIPALVAHFMQHHNCSRRVPQVVGGAALRQLTAYDWPGNVRELKNLIERAIILSRESKTIRADHLALGAGHGQANVKVSMHFEQAPTLDELQAEYLRLQLAKHSGHRAKVAQVLAVSERNIYRLIRRYGLHEPS